MRVWGYGSKKAVWSRGGKVLQWEHKQGNFQSAQLASAAMSPNSRAQNFEYEIYIPLEERKTNLD